LNFSSFRPGRRAEKVINFVEVHPPDKILATPM